MKYCTFKKHLTKTNSRQVVLKDTYGFAKNKFDLLIRAPLSLYIQGINSVGGNSWWIDHEIQFALCFEAPVSPSRHISGHRRSEQIQLPELFVYGS